MRRRQIFQAFGAAFAASALGAGFGGASAFAQSRDQSGEQSRDQAREQSLDKARRVERPGLQLYTLRGAMVDDFEGTLARVAEMGYREMEFAGYFGRDAGMVREALERNGLSSPAAHLGLNAVRENLAAEIDFAAELGQRFLVVPYLPEDERGLDDYRRLAETLNRAGEQCRAAGLKMGYHNHDFEFAPTGGRIPYDLLLEETDPELVDMELDLYWIAAAGHDTLAYFDAHPGRFTMLHVKDRAADGAIADVGAGGIDFAALFAHGETAGIAHYFVEHDNPGGDGFGSVARSLEHLRGLRF